MAGHVNRMEHFLLGEAVCCSTTIYLQASLNYPYTKRLMDVATVAARYSFGISKFITNMHPLQLRGMLLIICVVKCIDLTYRCQHIASVVPTMSLFFWRERFSVVVS